MSAATVTNILVTITLALSGWTLATVQKQAEQGAKLSERTDTNQRDLAELRARVVSAEATIVLIQIKLAERPTR